MSIGLGRKSNRPPGAGCGQFTALLVASLYNLSMPTLSPDQEQQVADALVAIGEMETAESLKMEAITTVERVLSCSHDEAQEVIDDLQERRLVEMNITLGGQLDARRPMPIARWRWSHLRREN